MGIYTDVTDDHHNRTNGVCIHGHSRGECPHIGITASILALDVTGERDSQDAKHGRSSWPNGTGHKNYRMMANGYQIATRAAISRGLLSWKDLLLEEVYEALSEKTDEALRAELVQVAALVVAWIEDIDSRSSDG